MLGLYWFALVVGGGFLVVSLLGDIVGGHGGDLGGHDADLSVDHDVDLSVDHDVDLGVDHDVEVGVDHDVEVGAEQGIEGGGHAVEHVAQGGEAHPMHILSLRTATYFMFGFGAMGVVLNAGESAPHPVVTLLSSMGVGSLAAAISVLVFGWLRKTEAGGRETETSFVGLEARVVLPLGPGRTGRIAVRRGVREYELSARPFGAERGEVVGWKRVVIVDMHEGTALVAPYGED